MALNLPENEHGELNCQGMGVAVGGGIDEGASASQDFSPPKGAPGAAALAASPDDSTGQTDVSCEFRRNARIFIRH
jgi:hypothetical protein